MRLTVNLKEDIYRVAKSMAIAEDCSISVALNKLLERAIAGREPNKEGIPGGLPIVSGRRPFTSLDVYKIDQL